MGFIITILIQNLSYLGLTHHRPRFFRLFTQSGPYTLTFGAGSDLAFTCPRSVDVDVFTGPVELSFDTPYGILSSATLDTGFSLLVESPEFVTDPQVLEVIAPLDNPGPITLMMGDWAGDDTWYRSQSYGIVPIPSALWLFGSGLLGLIGISRIKKIA